MTSQLWLTAEIMKTIPNSDYIMKKKRFKVKMTLSDGSERWVKNHQEIAILEGSLAKVYVGFVNTHGYADSSEAIGLSWAGEFGSIEYLESVGVQRILIIKSVELFEVL